MNPIVSFVLQGQPQVYKSKGQSPIRNELKLQARKQYSGRPLKGPLRMDIIFYVEPPKHLLPEVKQGKITYPLNIGSKIDSMTYLVCKYLRHVAFSDSSQIVDLRARKIYDMNPRTDIAVSHALII